MADRRLLLPEVRKAHHRLGRHINHDPRSLSYRVGATATPKTVRWERHIAPLDQGDLGSCTGNATVGSLATGTNWAALSPAQRSSLDEALAVAIYSDGTRLDSYPGSYAPDDTGCDGLSVAKAAQQRGLISGYRHITSLGEAHAGIQAGSLIGGFSWFAGMDTPDKKGLVQPTGAVRGGHEWQILGYDLDTDLWECVNSWGEGWGLGGRFFLTTKALTYLMSQQGDMTLFVPLSEPAPVPAPPAPADPLASYPRELVDVFAGHPRAWKNATTAAQALLEFEKVAFPS